MFLLDMVISPFDILLYPPVTVGVALVVTLIIIVAVLIKRRK
jgi:hypothetical protein